MQERKSGDKLLLVLGILFTIIALVAIVALVRLKSRAAGAENTNQRVGTENAAPTDLTLTITDADNDPVAITDFTPTEGTTKELRVFGTVSDSNGCTDLASATVYVFLTDGTATSTCNGSCDANYNSVYTTSTTAFEDCFGSSDPSASYHLTMDVQNFAKPSGAGAPDEAKYWAAYVAVSDGTDSVNSGDDSGLAHSIEMGSLIAFKLYNGDPTYAEATLIDYDSLALGAVSPQDAAKTVIRFSNTGNITVQALANSNGNLLSTGYDPIPTANVRASSTSNFVYNDTPDYGIPAAGNVAIEFSLTKQTAVSGDVQGTSSTEDGYFKIKMPAAGSGSYAGTYSNIITLTADAI